MTIRQTDGQSEKIYTTLLSSEQANKRAANKKKTIKICPYILNQQKLPSKLLCRVPQTKVLSAIYTHSKKLLQ